MDLIVKPIDPMGIIIKQSEWGTYPDDERAEICKKIRERAMGKISDDEWASFTSCLNRVADVAKG